MRFYNNLWFFFFSSTHVFSLHKNPIASKVKSYKTLHGKQNFKKKNCTCSIKSHSCHIFYLNFITCTICTTKVKHVVSMVFICFYFYHYWDLTSPLPHTQNFHLQWNKKVWEEVRKLLKVGMNFVKI